VFRSCLEYCTDPQSSQQLSGYKLAVNRQWRVQLAPNDV
jgi:hypothetical protein